MEELGFQSVLRQKRFKFSSKLKIGLILDVKRFRFFSVYLETGKSRFFKEVIPEFCGTNSKRKNFLPNNIAW